MSKKMQKALQAFINEDVEQAKKLLRQVFVESAQKVNKELEEEYDGQMDEPDLNEDVDQDPESDLTDEVGYKLDEDFDDEQGQSDDKSTDGWESGNDQMNSNSPVDEADESGELSVEHGDDYGTDEQSQETGGWADIQSRIDELAEIFDKLANGAGSDEEQIDITEPSGDVDVDGGDDLSDIQMGSDKVGEAYKMKSVPEVQKTEKEGINKKSPVAPNAKSPVQGVQPVKIKDGTVVVTDDKFKNSDALDARVDDNNNVMDSAKGMMKDVAAPKNTAEKSRSPLPKQK